MARVYEIGMHLLAVLDAGDALTDPKRFVLARLIARDGTKHDELMDVTRCAGLLKHLRQHGAKFFGEPCEALPLGIGPPASRCEALRAGPRCSDIVEVRVWTKQWVAPLGNGGFACYLPKGRILWSRWGTLVRSLRRDLALHPHEPLTPSEFALLIGDKLDGRTVVAWHANERISTHYYEPQFLRLRAAVDAMHTHWILAYRHPPLHEFVRGDLPGTEIPVLKLLKTDEGAAQVMNYIASTGDPQFLRRDES